MTKTRNFLLMYICKIAAKHEGGLSIDAENHKYDCIGLLSRAYASEIQMDEAQNAYMNDSYYCET